MWRRNIRYERAKNLSIKYKLVWSLVAASIHTLIRIRSNGWVTCPVFNSSLHVSMQQFKKKIVCLRKTNFETFDVKHQNSITVNFPLILHFANEIEINH